MLDRKGTFKATITGTYDGGKARAALQIVPGSGT